MYFRDAEHINQCISIIFIGDGINCFHFILIHDLYGFLQDPHFGSIQKKT